MKSELPDPSDYAPGRAITLNSKISVSLLLYVVPLIFSAAILWFKLDSIQRDIRRQWTIPYQSVWVERLHSANPTIIIPSVKDVVNTVDGQKD